MRSFVGTRTAEEIIGASLDVAVLSWEALVFGVIRVILSSALAAPDWLIMASARRRVLRRR